MGNGVGHAYYLKLLGILLKSCFMCASRAHLGIENERPGRPVSDRAPSQMKLPAPDTPGT